MGSSTTRAGRLEPQPDGYRAFIPAPLPPPDLRLQGRLQQLVSRADIAVGRLDGAVSVIPNPDLFVFMYVRRESVLSSQIEGTNASLMDVLEYEATAEEAEQTVDVAEIMNHIRAMQHGLDRLRDIPLSRRLLCEVHAQLMTGVRGGEPSKTPGELRRSQNWIGGVSPDSARFVPPPAEVVGPAFADLERFLHTDDSIPALVKAGIAHAQFETIHPFLDGNGRVGRLLITFWLVEQGILRRPILYPSVYLKEHRDEYIDRLQAIRDEGAWEAWLEFFLDGIAHVAAEATDRALQILALRERDRASVERALGRRAPNGLRLLDALFSQPTVSVATVRRLIGVSQPTAAALVRDLQNAGILEEITGKRRYRIFRYGDYLSLFPGVEARS